MAITVLVPTSLPNRCYLMEALLWVAVNRFPLSSRTIEGAQGDDREDSDYLEHGADPRFPYDLTINDEECSRAGLPPNPAYEALQSGKEYHSPNFLKSLLRWSGASETHRLFAQFHLPEAEEFHNRQADWDLKFSVILDDAKVKLLRALQENRVNAFGIRIASEELRELIFPPTEAPPLMIPEKPAWAPISASFWQSNDIPWEGCWAESGESAYLLVLVDTARLLESFPPPKPEPFFGVVRIATTLALRDTTDRLPRPRRGRPSYPWPEILAEVDRRARTTGLPAKQEALVEMIGEWCRENLPSAPARSTLAAQLRVFYDSK